MGQAKTLGQQENKCQEWRKKQRGGGAHEEPKEPSSHPTAAAQPTRRTPPATTSLTAASGATARDDRQPGQARNRATSNCRARGAGTGSSARPAIPGVGQRANARDPAAAPKGFKGINSTHAGVGRRPVTHTLEHALPDNRPARDRTRPAADGRPQTGGGGEGSAPGQRHQRALNWAPSNRQATQPLPMLVAAGRRPHQNPPRGPQLGPISRATRTMGLGPSGPSTSSGCPRTPHTQLGALTQLPADQRAPATTPLPPHPQAQQRQAARQQTHLAAAPPQAPHYHRQSAVAGWAQQGRQAATARQCGHRGWGGARRIRGRVAAPPRQRRARRGSQR